MIDVIPLAFLYVFFGAGGMPQIDLSNVRNLPALTSKPSIADDLFKICGIGGHAFPNSKLIDCSFMASDIKQCQAKGKKITLSLGGATAKVGFNSKSLAESFAEEVWNMFLGADSSPTRGFLCISSITFL
jgi:chitinase